MPQCRSHSQERIISRALILFLFIDFGILTAASLPIIPDPGVSVSPGSICCGECGTVTIPVENLKDIPFSGRIEIEIADASGNVIFKDSIGITLAPKEKRVFQTPICPPCSSVGNHKVKASVIEDSGKVHDTKSTYFVVRGDCPKCNPGPTETYRCVDNKVERLYKKNNCTEEWLTEKDCSLCNDPPCKCAVGSCIHVPGGSSGEDDEPDQCNPEECQGPVGGPYSKNGKMYQRYKECVCDGNKCECQSVEKAEPEELGDIRFIGTYCKFEQSLNSVIDYFILEKLLEAPNKNKLHLSEGDLIGVEVYNTETSIFSKNIDLNKGDRAEIYARLVNSDKSKAILMTSINAEAKYNIKKLALKQLIDKNVYISQNWCDAWKPLDKHFNTGFSLGEIYQIAPCRCEMKSCNELLQLAFSGSLEGTRYATAIDSKKTDYCYGRYMARFKAASCGKSEGVVTGFFTYWNGWDNDAKKLKDNWDRNQNSIIDNSEIDFEILGACPSIIYLTIWTDSGGEVEYNNIRTLAGEHKVGKAIDLQNNIIYKLENGEYKITEERLQKSIPNFDASKSYYTYGFDWRENFVKFFILDESGQEITLWDFHGKPDFERGFIPSHPGNIICNVWHTGGTDGWHAICQQKDQNLEPPKNAAVMEIEWIKYQG